MVTDIKSAVEQALEIRNLAARGHASEYVTLPTYLPDAPCYGWDAPDCPECDVALEANRQLATLGPLVVDAIAALEARHGDPGCLDCDNDRKCAAGRVLSAFREHMQEIT